MHFTQKVGRLTVAASLIGIGIALLLDNLGAVPGATQYIFKFWPVLMVGFGLEYLIRTVISSLRPPEESQVSMRPDIGGAFLVGLVILLSFGVLTLRNLTTIDSGRLTFVGGPSYSQSQSLAVPADRATALDVRVAGGWVKLQQHNDPAVRVEATYTVNGFIVDTERIRAKLDQIKLTATEGETIEIRSELPSDLNNVTVRFTVYAPPNLKVKLNAGAGFIQVTNYTGDMDLRSGVGRTEVASGKGTVYASSGSGSITVRNFEGPITARTSVGHVDMQNIVGAMQLDSGSGAINVRQFQGGKLVAETGTGAISVITDAVLNGDLALKTSTGAIRLELPRESSMRVTAQTRAGSLSLPPFVTVNGTGPARTGAGTSGDGKFTVSLEANLGAISFTTR